MRVSPPPPRTHGTVHGMRAPQTYCIPYSNRGWCAFATSSSFSSLAITSVLWLLLLLLLLQQLAFPSDNELGKANQRISGI
mmetsp:Transcript_15260/g.21230  ORF Transcript_15260/g.21230 Transcript_15260/m.21230 type:complete len:81 (+) Transcript_15260:13-255(+)